MKKILLSYSLVSCLSIVSSNIYAADENSISVGYAQSHAKADGASLGDGPQGFNLKYRYEFNDHWGVINSFAYTHKGYDFYYGNSKIGSGNIDFYSLSTGPIFRINEYVSLYGLIGASHGKSKLSFPDQSDSVSKTAMLAGLGGQFNPYQNVVIDVSYEYSKLDDVKVGTWMLGAGYRF
ncbi:Ail/Lom family outer membrane beta-barrel protein [Yersinia wautersii]|uniref:Attachment invasion locus protein n=1 Tax=Yersinia wautersii TaxID=1341643 RepID=A0ABP1ZKD3_9GAMM|nr:Ail/Lom family outer membrane beta-barrel protein [Yersinia wautersii]CRG52220.1 attachment invasion locus protein [Yersinia wautersii]